MKIRNMVERIKDGYLKEMWGEWKWIASHFKSHALGITFFLLVGIISTVMSLASSVASKYLIDAVTGHQSDRIAVYGALTVGLALFSILASNGITILSVKIRTKVENEIQEKIYNDIIFSEWLSVSRLRNGDILNRLNNDSSAIATAILEMVPALINNLIAFIGSLCIMLYYDPVMAMIALVSAPIAAAVSYGVVKKIRIFNKEMMVAQSEKMSFTEDSVSNLQTLKALGLGKFFGVKMRGQLKKVRGITIRNNKYSVRYQNILSVIGLVATYGCYMWGVYRLWSGFITFGTMTLFIQLAGRVRGEFGTLVGMAPKFVSVATRASRVMELEGFPKEAGFAKETGFQNVQKFKNEQEFQSDVRIHSNKESLESSKNKNRLVNAEHIEKIVVENVSFSYDRDIEVLKNVSFEAKRGEITALIGPSGEGKTTIGRLMLGLAAPNEGRLCAAIDGSSNIIPLDAKTRRLFSYVPQGNTLFAGSIAENVRMGRLDATDDEIIAALKTADAWGFIEKLEGKTDYVLGEHGKGISEGQAQRICIARAIIRNAPIILMDEATSALDPWTEKRVLDNIMKVDDSKIIIVTAHRQSVMDMCTRIYRVGGGKVEPVTEGKI